MREHTIVVRFPEGVSPAYSVATEFQGGQVVAVAFDGDRLQIAEELEEALSELTVALAATDLDGLGLHAKPFERARDALAKARKVAS